MRRLGNLGSADFGGVPDAKCYLSYSMVARPGSYLDPKRRWG
jgi:hypothetical protein